MDVTISTATPADIDALVASVAELFQEDGGRHDPFMDLDWPARDGARYYAGLIDDPGCLLALARAGERVIGHLIGKLDEPGGLRTARFAILESMRVDPQARGKGVGAMLVAEFRAWARRHGAERASVTAFAGNAGAQRFYARHGFVPQSIMFRAPL